MIQIIDMCQESLSRFEFVDPIANIIKGQGHDVTITHFKHYEFNAGVDKIIICGTALKDLSYIEHLDRFSWMRIVDVPVLGICSGMQAIVRSFEGDIIPWTSIGMDNMEIIEDTKVLGKCRIMEGYHLHNFGVILSEEFRVIARNGEYIEAVKHKDKDIYGIIFHPEVRNRWTVENFIAL